MNGVRRSTSEINAHCIHLSYLLLNTMSTDDDLVNENFDNKPDFACATPEGWGGSGVEKHV